MFARIGIVTGVRREAAALGHAGDAHWLVRCSGANAEAGYQHARALAADGVEALLSAGLAGGLDPRLGPGAVIVADEVHAIAGNTIDPMASASLRTRLASVFTVRGHAQALTDAPPPVSADASYRPDPRLIEALAALGGRAVHVGAMAAVDHVIAKRDEKLGLFGKTRALGVDMESQGVARAAAEAGIPFGVIRVVLDPSNREMPRAMMRAVKPDGGTNIGGFLGGLLLNPFEIGACVSLVLDAAIAFRSLRRVGRGLAPALLRGL